MTTSVKNSFLPPSLISNLQQVLITRKDTLPETNSNHDHHILDTKEHPSCPASNLQRNGEQDSEKPIILVTNGEGIESRRNGVSSENDLKDAATVCLPLVYASVRDIQKGAFPTNCLLNVQIPSSSLANKGFKVTKQSLWRSSLSGKAVSTSKHSSAPNFLSNHQSLGINLAQLGRDASAAGEYRD